MRLARVFVAALLAVESALCGCRSAMQTGTEDAAADDASENLDAGPVGFMSPPLVPVLDSGPCTVVVASDYDQSCQVDTDCVMASEVGACPVDPNVCYGCPLATISASAQAKFNAAFWADFTVFRPPACHCPAIGYPCCRAGTCKPSCYATPSDTLPACTDAGGTCIFPARFGCPTPETSGPPDACAYSDQICCVPG